MSENLRLLVVASTFPGQPGDGTPGFVKDLSLRLGVRFDTVVLVPRVPGAPRSEQVGDVRVERFAYFPRRWEDLAHGAIIENLRESPLRWLQVLPFLASEAVHLRRLVKRHRPHVLHVHWVIPQGMSALVAARRVPWVVTTLGGDVYALHDPVTSRLKRAVLRRAAAVTTMNDEMRQRLVDSGAPEATTYVQSLGADISGLRSMVRADAHQVPGHMLFVGRLVEKKGLAVLIDALRLLPADLDWMLEVVGDGPLESSLRAEAKGLPVTFSGPMSREDLANAYERSVAVVVPSVPASSGDQDGLPTVLLEAMGSGRAVVASDLPGINEAVTDGETGRLVPPDDPGALAKALTAVLTDGELRQRLAAAAERRSRDFTVEACARRYADILTTAAHAGGAADTTATTRTDAARSGWRARVTENRHAIDVALAHDAEGRKRLSPALLGLTDAVVPALRSRATGQFLDAGCGTQPFRAVVEGQVERYLTLDVEARTDQVDYIADLEDMGVVRDASIDTVLCSEVLEHVPHPERAVREIARVLRPGGSLVITVPFMARLHEEPHDYFRYTRHGLRLLLLEAGFEVDDIVETGSLFSFLGHQASVVLLGLTWHRPALRRLAVLLNEVVVVRPAAALDRLTHMARLLPLGYMAIATRQAPDGPPG
jgi:glycosyltransferase involved in cell wall biosynthesis/SAM-dependent methyltransferase